MFIEYDYYGFSTHSVLDPVKVRIHSENSRMTCTYLFKLKFRSYLKSSDHLLFRNRNQVSLALREKPTKQQTDLDLAMVKTVRRVSVKPTVSSLH